MEGRKYQVLLFDSQRSLALRVVRKEKRHKFDALRLNFAAAAGPARCWFIIKLLNIYY
jgi:hypothetical protein